MTYHSHSLNLRAALSTILAVCVLSFGAAQAAEPDVETQSVSVDLGDIDVFSPVGLAVAQDRIAMAANRACGGPDFMDLSTSGRFDRCHRQAMSTALNDLNLRIAAMQSTNGAVSTIASR